VQERLAAATLLLQLQNLDFLLPATPLASIFAKASGFVCNFARQAGGQTGSGMKGEKHPAPFYHSQSPLRFDNYHSSGYIDSITVTWCKTSLFMRKNSWEDSMTSFKGRIIRAAKLDANLYEEVEADKESLGQAMLVVVLSSVAAGVGSIGHVGITGILIGTITALIGWFFWAWLTYFIGTKLLPEPQTRADVGELLRTIGFSSSPGLIRVLGIIPGLAVLVNLAAMIWMLAAMIIAVRQALDYTSTLRAVGVCCIGWVIQILIIAFLFSIFGAPATTM
jgi:hypothetical protein